MVKKRDIEELDIVEETYGRIVRPVFKTAKRVPYFEWRIRGFRRESLQKLLGEQMLMDTVQKFALKYPRDLSTHGFSFSGDHHGKRFVQMDCGKGLKVSYLRNWRFKWGVFGRDCTFYRENAYPDDCVVVSSEGVDSYLGDLAAIQSALLLQEGKNTKLLGRTKLDFSKLSEKRIRKLTSILLTQGVIATYLNDLDYQGMSGEYGRESPTGRMTDSYESEDFDEKGGQRDEVMKQFREMQDDRKKFEIIRFMPPKLRKEDKKPSIYDVPSRSPGCYCTGHI